MEIEFPISALWVWQVKRVGLVVKWAGLVEGYSQYQRTITAIHLAPDDTVTEVSQSEITK